MNDSESMFWNTYGLYFTRLSEQQQNCFQTLWMDSFNKLKNLLFEPLSQCVCVCVCSLG